MDSTKSTRANLKKYIKVAGMWRFVPILKQNGVPHPGTVLIGGNPVRSTSGTFYLEFYENGKRIRRPVGTSPREAKDAWNLRRRGEQSSTCMFEDEKLPPELLFGSPFCELRRDRA